MFGPFWIPDDTPIVEVTREEFKRLMVANGKTQKEAEMQAKVCAIMGSQVLIGKSLYTIKKK